MNQDKKNSPNFAHYALGLFFLYMGIVLMCKAVSLIPTGGEATLGGIFLTFFSTILICGSVISIIIKAKASKESSAPEDMDREGRAVVTQQIRDDLSGLEHRGQSTRQSVKFLSVCGSALMLLGCVGFFGAFIISVWQGDMLSDTELPLGSPSGIAVDHQGRIYVGSRGYMRVQRYAADGEFDRGWHVAGGKGDWHMLLDEKNQLTLMVGDSFIYYLGDRDQLLQLSERPDKDLLEQLRHTPIEHAVTRDKSTYHLQSFPAGVSREDKDGHRHIVFRQGIFMFLVTSPFPAFIIFMMGIILSIFQKRT